MLNVVVAGIGIVADLIAWERAAAVFCCMSQEGVIAASHNLALTGADTVGVSREAGQQ